MAWQDTLLPASFRGIRFHVETWEWEGGRAGVTHEFPQRDAPFDEEMGRTARKFFFSAYVIGEDYVGRSRALAAACEARGHGTMSHPSFGVQRVRCVRIRQAEERRRGRIARFDLEFVEAGGSAPAFVTILPSALVQTAAATLGGAAADAMASTLTGRR